MKYLIIGSKGQLGKEFVQKFNELGEKYICADRDELDITSLDAVNNFFDKYKPRIVINCSAYNLVDKAETDSFDAFNVNSIGVYNLAIASKNINAYLVHYSSDYVFDGLKNELYVEEDLVNPLNEYGRSKLLGEKIVSNYSKNYLIFRLSWVYGDGEQNFMYKVKAWAEKNSVLKISNDEISVPTSTKTVVDVTLKALDKKLNGLYHLVNSEYCSRYDWVKLVLKELKLKNKVEGVSKEDFNLPAKRPSFSAMSNEKLSKVLDIKIENWDKAVSNFLLKK